MVRTRAASAGKSFSGVDGKSIKKKGGKVNFLGRMLKFVDKDGLPEKLFAYPCAGSLSRILRRHSHNEDNGIIDKPRE
ncbi:hypothetical protein PUN28_006940 [Cardiocondyla obscurior]|uniref:Uncharacterized protein n=1 Tax=Cardiocondyla obscurior TaxID=286306 RepID=A0AAW2G2P4_9HYME